MRRTQQLTRAAVSLAIGLALAAVLSASDHPLAEHPDVAARLQILDGWLANTVAEREQPAISVGIVYDQDLIWAKGYGFADVASKRAATPATVYRVASISKLFTATALMQLRDAGKIRLDDPVATYLPWFKVKDSFADSPPITIRHLMTHTSGLPRNSAGMPDGEVGWPTREQMIEALAAQATVLDRDTEFKYSNLAWALAGEVVAAVSGQAYEAYVDQHILRPLGMTSSTMRPTPDTAGLATPYTRRVPGKARRIARFSDWAGMTPAANLATSVEDLAKFASLQFRSGPAGGPNILRGSTIREMHRVQWLRPNWQSGQGLGFAIRRVGEQVQVGHGGSTPGFRTQIQIVPAQKLAVIVLTNADDGDPGSYLDEVLETIGPAIATATAKPRPEPVADPAWQAYVGNYGRPDDPDANTEFVVLNNRLTMVTTGSSWNGRVPLTPAGPHTFRMQGGSTSGELVVFDVGPDGRATSARVATSSIKIVRKQGGLNFSPPNE